MRIRIEALKRMEDFRECEAIQLEVWGTLGVAAETLKVTAEYGGAVIGARAGKVLAGFLYAFPGVRHGERIHWSHQMAVRAGWRDRGLGFRMKLSHRRAAIRQGIWSICWTFDPLQSRNAALNIGRLGARAEEYVVNCYGDFPSRIEKGLATDRFVVNWRIADGAVELRLRKSIRSAIWENLSRGNETAVGRNGMRVNRKLHPSLREPRLLIEIPPNTDLMRANAIQLARRWREETRSLFVSYFARRYQAVEFIAPSASTGGRCFYILERQ